MSKQVTPEELKTKSPSLEVNMSQLIRRALGQGVERTERERIRELAREAGRILERIPSEDLVRAIRKRNGLTNSQMLFSDFPVHCL